MRSIAICSRMHRTPAQGFNTASGMRSIAIRPYICRCSSMPDRFNTASGMRSIAMSSDEHPKSGDVVSIPQAVWGLLQSSQLYTHCHLRHLVSIPQAVWGLLQYGRDLAWTGSSLVSIPQAVWGLLQLVDGIDAQRQHVFQYRKRYEVYCNHGWAPYKNKVRRFNTASGMRSIAISITRL